MSTSFLGQKNSFLLGRVVQVLKARGIAIVLIACTCAYASTPSRIPHGIFSLQKADTPAPTAILSSPLITGISLRTKWTTVENSENTYDWSFIDGEVTKATLAGKSILLRAISGGVNVPDWVYPKGAQKFSYIDMNSNHPTYGQAMTMAVPWDPVFLQEKIRFIQAAGVKYSNNSNIKVVGEAAANSSTDDWHIPHTSADIQNWNAIGYTSQKLINVCELIIDTTMAAFPKQAMSMAFWENGKLDNPSDLVSRSVMAYARGKYGSRFIIEINNLSDQSPDPQTIGAITWQDMKNSGPPVAAQMLWFVTNDQTYRMAGGTVCDPSTALKKAMDIGLMYGTKFQEVYSIDVQNPALQPMLQSISQSFH
jgi:hypothetical protein